MTMQMGERWSVGNNGHNGHNLTNGWMSSKTDHAVLSSTSSECTTRWQEENNIQEIDSN